MADFVIPELGENIAGGDVVRIMVKPGDAITKDQPVLELETDEATAFDSVAWLDCRTAKTPKAAVVQVSRATITVVASLTRASLRSAHCRA